MTENDVPAGAAWQNAPSDDAGLLRMFREQLPASLRYEEGDRPAAPLVRWVKPDLWPQAQADCMTAHGFGAEARQGGISYATVPPEQTEAQRRARYVCFMSYPFDPRTTLPLPRERVELQYRHLVDVVGPCAEEQLGLEVQAAPSFEVWYADYQAQEAPWHPFNGIGEVNIELLDRAHALCPDQAPNLYPDDLRG